MDKVFISRILDRCIYFALLLLFLTSCGNGTGNAKKNRLGPRSVESVRALKDTLIQMDSHEEQLMGFGSNPFFPSWSGIRDLVEACDDSLRTFVSKRVNLDGQYESAVLSIRNDNERGLTGYVSIGEKSYLLYPISDTDAAACFLTVCAYDLDGDGTKELLAHDGDLFSTRIFRLHSSEPVYVGSLSSNSGFFVTDDGIIVSLIGSQGNATMAKYSRGKIKILDEEGYIDKILYGSKDYYNLRYLFNDNEEECHEIDRIYPAEHYIICDQGSIYGDNCFSVDLDGDRTLEQLYLSRPGWGMTSWDEMRVLIPGTRTSYDLSHDILAADDPRTIERSEYDWRFKDLIQLSAMDVNGDGKMEIIASVGSRDDHVNFIWSYDRKHGPKLLLNNQKGND